MSSPFQKKFSAKSPIGGFNAAMYESDKFLKKVKADPLGADLTKVNTFRPRGKDAYSNSLKDDTVIEPSFTNEGDDSSYEYLSSRFNINPTINDPMERGNLRNRGSSNTVSSRNTVAQDLKNKQDNDAKLGYTGVKQTLKEANQGAKVSADISKNLATAKATGSESNLKSAIETARTDMSNDKFLRSTRPVRTNPRTGKTEVSNQASYRNARMVQDFIDQSQTATKRQNSSDRLRFTKNDLDANVKRGKYDLKYDTSLSGLANKVVKKMGSTRKKKNERSGN